MNRRTANLTIVVRLCSMFLLTFFSIAALAQAQTQIAGAKNQPVGTYGSLKLRFRPSLVNAGFALMPPSAAYTNTSSNPTASRIPMFGGPNPPVLGSGTVGRLAKWTGQTGTNSFIGDTIIFEDKFGNVGIGTDSPTSKLTVAGNL